jgi:hypothetical protein
MKRTLLCALVITTALTAGVAGQVQSLTSAKLARFGEGGRLSA